MAHNRPAIDQRDVQILSDIRLMALSLQKLIDKTQNKCAVQVMLARIIRDCESIIAVGPPEFRHIIASTASLAEIDRELRSSLNPESRA